MGIGFEYLLGGIRELEVSKARNLISWTIPELECSLGGRNINIGKGIVTHVSLRACSVQVSLLLLGHTCFIG